MRGLAGRASRRVRTDVDPPPSLLHRAVPRADLRQLSMQINSEREMFKVKLAQCCMPLTEIFMLHCLVGVKLPSSKGMCSKGKNMYEGDVCGGGEER